jgi:hypothetical protein
MALLHVVLVFGAVYAALSSRPFWWVLAAVWSGIGAFWFWVWRRGK